MDYTGHTEGEWAIEPIPESPHLAIMSTILPADDEDPKNIREVEIATVIMQDDEVEGNANARLIASAPKLLLEIKDPHKDHPHHGLGKVSSLGIDMSLPADEFVGKSTEAHYRKKILDPIREQVEKLRDALGDETHGFNSGEKHAYNLVLSIIGEGDKVSIYAQGPVYCSVCAPAYMDAEDVGKEVNRQSPTGIDSPWRVKDEEFAAGEPNPYSCSRDTLRKHWLLSC